MCVITITYSTYAFSIPRSFVKERCIILCGNEMTKSRRMKWAGHVARWGRGEDCTGFWWGNLRERDHLEYPGVDGRIILRWIFRKWDVRAWTESSWLRIETGGGHL
jgi:hypothetical protein